MRIPSLARARANRAQSPAKSERPGYLTARAGYLMVMTAGLLFLLTGCSTAAVSGLDGAAQVVDSAAVVQVMFTSSQLSVATGQSAQPEVHALAEDGSVVPFATFEWTSSDPAVAQVSGSGTVAGGSAGGATIAARFMEHEAELSVSVTNGSGAFVPAFPGAEGFGAIALNNCRSKPVRIHRVTNTSGRGPGSLASILADKVSSAAYDIVVFETGGTITVGQGMVLDEACVYIAGQTAPGGGVQIRGPNDPNHQVTPFRADRARSGHDIVIRYLRVRVGKGTPEIADNIQLAGSYNVVLDHISTAFDNDKSILISPADLNQGALQSDHITIQWSLITTSLMPHSTGSPIGSDINEPDIKDISVHHNGFIHNSHRNPLIKRVKCVEVVNNVVYNYKARVGKSFDDACIDYVGNYYRRGPWSNETQVLQHGIQENPTNPAKNFVLDPSLYLSGNIAEHKSQASQTELVNYVGDRSGPLPASAFRSSRRAHPVFEVEEHSAGEAFERVLDEAGASLRLTCAGEWVPARDGLDQRLVADVRNGSGPSEESQSDHQADHGGYPSLQSGSGCLDSDSDGMPDEFENRWQLDPYDPGDAAGDLNANGYLNIEEYLNGRSPR